MRVLGVDLGRKRIGLALSDVSAVLARPWKAMAAGGPASRVAADIASAMAEAADPLDDSAGVGAVVIGLPRRLNGEDNAQTQHARDVAAALATLTGLHVHLQDERLTSREAEARLAEREPDWRRRKALIDAAAAAIILQDYLDSPAAAAGRTTPTTTC